MAYVATRGGEAAIQQAEQLFHELRGEVDQRFIQQVMEAMPYLLDRVMSEAGLFAPELAALALAQTGGDLYESVLLLRAYCSTQPRLAYASVITPEKLLTVRRISAAFKDIPGGQILGPTLDYSHRLLKMQLLNEAQPTPTGEAASAPESRVALADEPAKPTYPLVADWQREQGLLARPAPQPQIDPQSIPDITREPVVFPAPRAHRLQALARGDSSGILALGYASMRGYGLTHPTVNELRLAYADVTLKHPISGVEFSAGRVRVSQAEVVSTGGGTSEKPMLELGFAATLGWNEVKVIAASMLDLEMGKPSAHPAHKEEFVLYHTESVESSGFCIHYKLPHYVTFASGLDNIRQARESQERRMHEGIFVQTLFAPGPGSQENPESKEGKEKQPASTNQPEPSA